MAELRDLIVTGPTRLVGDAYGKISSATTVPVVNNNTTLSFGGQRTIASIGGQNVTVVMPSGGAQGRQGPRGTDATGSQGEQGPQGPKGTDATGNQGRQGPRGTDATGSQGRQGPIADVPAGLDEWASEHGTSGDDWGDYAYLHLRGDQGPQGPKGSQGPLNTAGQITVYNGNNSSTYYYLMGATGTTTGVTSNVYRAGTSTTSGVYWKNFDLYASSDERLKNIIEDIYPDLDRLRTIPKVFYRWKKEDADSKPHVGTSAQRLRDVYPELVDEGEDGLLSVAYDRLSIIALAAIDKLHKENEELKKEIETIKEKIRKMEGEI